MNTAQHATPQPFARRYIGTFIEELLASTEKQPSPDATEILWKASSRFIARKNPAQETNGEADKLEKHRQAIGEIAKTHGHAKNAETIWNRLHQPFANRIKQHEPQWTLYNKASTLNKIFHVGLKPQTSVKRHYLAADLFQTLLNPSSPTKKKSDALTLLWGGSCSIINTSTNGNIMNIHHHQQALRKMAQASGYGDRFDMLWTGYLRQPFQQHINKLNARSQAKPVENKTAAGIPLDLQAGSIIKKIFDGKTSLSKSSGTVPTYKKSSTKPSVERIGVAEPVFLRVDPQVRAKTKTGQESDPRGIRIYSFSPELNRHAIVSNHPELPVLIIEGQKNDAFFEARSYEEIKAHPDTRTIYASRQSTFEKHLEHALTTPFSKIPKPLQQQDWSGTFNAVAQTCRSLKDAGFDGVPRVERHKTIAQFFEENKIEMLEDTREIAHRSFHALSSAIKRRQKGTDQPVIRGMPKETTTLDETIRTVYGWAPLPPS